jgi:hypothetical protein
MIDKNYVLTNLKYLLNPSISSNKIIYIFFGLLFSTLILDSSLLKIYSLLNSILNPGHQYFIFILIVFAFTISHFSSC